MEIGHASKNGDAHVDRANPEKGLQKVQCEIPQLRPSHVFFSFKDDPVSVESQPIGESIPRKREEVRKVIRKPGSEVDTCRMDACEE